MDVYIVATEAGARRSGMRTCASRRWTRSGGRAEEATRLRQVTEGPDLEREVVVCWRGRNLQKRIASECSRSLHERMMGNSRTRLRVQCLPVSLEQPQSNPRERLLGKSPGRPGLTP